MQQPLAAFSVWMYCCSFFFTSLIFPRIPCEWELRMTHQHVWLPSWKTAGISGCPPWPQILITWLSVSVQMSKIYSLAEHDDLSQLRGHGPLWQQVRTLTAGHLLASALYLAVTSTYTCANTWIDVLEKVTQFWSGMGHPGSKYLYSAFGFDLYTLFYWFNIVSILFIINGAETQRYENDQICFTHRPDFDVTAKSGSC